MAVKKFDHVAVVSRNIEASRKFYSEILGLTIGESVDIGNVILHYMRLADGSAIELFEYKDRTVYETLSEAKGFFKHLAFAVDNVDELNRKLIENNVKFEMNVSTSELLKARNLICFDPDGVVVELSQKIQGE
jgi:catechol 2,3-dioxygenase-like lactoylglutathione lyase family enzyme